MLFFFMSEVETFFSSFKKENLKSRYLFAIRERPIISNLLLSFHVIDR